MNKQIEALKIAIEVLEAIEIENGYPESMQIRAIQVCKEALAEVDKQEWQSLSDDEIFELHHKWIINSGNKDTQYDFARAIEQALKEKNNG